MHRRAVNFAKFATSPWTQNLYSYVGNNPVNYIDPTGHNPVGVGIMQLDNPIRTDGGYGGGGGAALAALMKELFAQATYVAPAALRSINFVINNQGFFIDTAAWANSDAKQVLDTIRSSTGGGTAMPPVDPNDFEQIVRAYKIANEELLGRFYQDYGYVVNETPINKINGFSRFNIDKPFHYIDSKTLRGVSSFDVLNTFNNPVAVFEQWNGGRFMYLSERAVVVLDKAGNLVTTYGASDFGPAIESILKDFIG